MSLLTWGIEFRNVKLLVRDRQYSTRRIWGQSFPEEVTLELYLKSWVGSNQLERHQKAECEKVYMKTWSSVAWLEPGKIGEISGCNAKLQLDLNLCVHC